MKPILFQPGNNPNLSYAELWSVNQRLQEPLHTIRYENKLILADSEDATSIAAELGGIIRVCEIQPDVEIPKRDDPSELADEIVAGLHSSELFAEMMQGEKVTFGLSALGVSPNQKDFFATTNKLVSARLKDKIKEQGHGVRFVPPKFPKDVQLSSVQVAKNHLLDKGCEFVLVVNENKITVARTIWVQPFDDYSFRDFGRPNRDDKSGMLPPKLARMLINLARTKETKTILDPFCGSGSILMEAGLMGLQATGSDISEKAVEDTHQNTAWLQQHVKEYQGNVQTIEGDVRDLHNLFEPLYFDACATEPFLGHPHSRPIPEQQFIKWSEELLKLYRRALGEIRTVCIPGARVIFIMPRFKIHNKPEPGALQILADLKFLGYTILDPMNGFEPTTKRASIVYSREKQAVQREIFILQA